MEAKKIGHKRYSPLEEDLEGEVVEFYKTLWEKSLTDRPSQYYVPEKYQLGILIQNFIKRYNIKYLCEGRLYGIPIDILGVQRDKTIAIELKSRNFKKGVFQAKRNTAFVDYSYLSMWKENITEKLLKEVKNLPVGLLSVDEGVECLVSAQKNTPNSYVKHKVRKMVKNEI